jgi:hypothetical protein
MKRITGLLIIVIAIIFSVQSCKKSSFDINRNPNTPTDSTISFNVILPAAQAATARVVNVQWGWLQNYLGYWARSGTYAPNTQEETYALTNSFQTEIWNDLYDNAYDYQAIINGSTKAGADFYQGIARIMKSHNFQILVDVYGNVPYSEALKGSGNTTPKYDKGNDIYADLLNQIDIGLGLIKNSSNSATGPNKDIVAEDVMFGTTVYPAGSLGVSAQIDAMKVRWAQFANTLKLRILMHLCNGGILTPQGTVPGFNIPAEIAKITAEGSGFLAPSESVVVNPGYRRDKPNPFFSTYIANTTGAVVANNDYYKANNWGITQYQINGDKRDAAFYKAGNNGLNGVAYGLPSITANAAAELAGIGDGLSGGADGYSKPARVFTATEGLFLQAEAIHRGFLPGGTDGAKAMLTKAIKESHISIMIGLNVNFPDVDYSASPLPPTAAFPEGTLPGGGLATIIDQKWFAMNGIAPFEVWTDYRRVNFSDSRGTYRYGIVGGRIEGPAISVSPGNTGTQIPIRLLYPQNEYNYNPANVGAQGAVNAFTSRVFWDAQ